MTAGLQWTAARAHFPVRSAVPSDGGRVARFLAAMDRSGLYQRHFAHGEAPNQALLSRLAVLDHRDRVAENGAAEFALMVLPGFRGGGIGKRMLRALLEIATAAGLERMHGMIQASNNGALKVALDSGFQVVAGDDHAVVIVSRLLSAGARAVTERSAAAVAVYPLLPNPDDPDRTPLHRRPVSGTPLRTGGR